MRFLPARANVARAAQPERQTGTQALSVTRLDSFLERIAPGIAEKRLMSRVRYRALSQYIEKSAQRSYEAGGYDRRTKDWRARPLDPNAAIGNVLATVRDRSRDLSRNNSWAKRAVDIVTADVVGTGIRAYAKDKSSRLEQAAQALWDEWAGTTACDADGRHTFYGLQRLHLREMVEAGEALNRFRPRRPEDGLPVPLQLQALEPDHIDTTRIGESADGFLQLYGIEFDKLGKRIRYWLYPQHPGLIGVRMTSLRMESVPIPADEVLHAFRGDRVGQVRGVPWGACCLVLMRDLDLYQDAQLVRQTMAGAYAAFVHVTDPTQANRNEWDLPDEIEPGAILKIPDGLEVKFATPPNVQGYPEHTESLLRAIAGGYGVTYEALTQNLAGANFTRARMGAIQHSREIDEFRELTFIPQICQPVWDRFMRFAVLSGRLSRPVACEWAAVRREFVDPVREVTALREKIRAGLCSHRQALRDLGSKDPDDVVAEIAAERAELMELGIKLSSIADHDLGREPDPVDDEDPDERDAAQAKAAD